MTEKTVEFNPIAAAMGVGPTRKEIEAEQKRQADRKRNKAARAERRVKRRSVLKKLGYRANRKMTKDKKTGKDLKGFFVEGTAKPRA